MPKHLWRSARITGPAELCDAHPGGSARVLLQAVQVVLLAVQRQHRIAAGDEIPNESQRAQPAVVVRGGVGRSGEGAPVALLCVGLCAQSLEEPSSFGTVSPARIFVLIFIWSLLGLGPEALEGILAMLSRSDRRAQGGGLRPMACAGWRSPALRQDAGDQDTRRSERWTLRGLVQRDRGPGGDPRPRARPRRPAGCGAKAGRLMRGANRPTGAAGGCRAAPRRRRRRPPPRSRGWSPPSRRPVSSRAACRSAG